MTKRLSYRPTESLVQDESNYINVEILIFPPPQSTL